MGQDKLTNTLLSQPQAADSSPNLGEQRVSLVAEEGASLSSGSLRLYALLSGSSPKLGEGDPKGGGVCGAIDLYNYDPLNRRAAVGIMVANEYRRQGYALAMLRELQALSTTNYQLHTLYADIAASNAASIALFAKAGYTQCGLFRQWLNVNDQYIDSVRMQKIL